MLMEKEIMTGDVFGISGRLQEIDPDYFIVFHRVLRRYEVHHRRQRDTLALVLPYRCLDARAVTLTLKTRRENIERLIKEMDAENRRREERADKEILDRAKGRLEKEIGRSAKE